MTLKHLGGPEGVREVGNPFCTWGAASLAWSSSREMAPEQVAMPNGLVQAQRQQQQVIGVWGCWPDKVPGGNHFELVLKVATIRDLLFSRCQAARGLRGGKGHGAPPGCQAHSAGSAGPQLGLTAALACGQPGGQWEAEEPERSLALQAWARL